MLLIGMAFIFLASWAAVSFPPAETPPELYSAPVVGFLLGGAIGIWYRARRVAQGRPMKFGTAIAVAGPPAADSRAWTAVLWGIPGAFAILALVIALNGGLDEGPAVERKYIVESGSCMANGECNLRLTRSPDSSVGPPFAVRRSRVALETSSIGLNDTVSAAVAPGFIGIPWIRRVSARKS